MTPRTFTARWVFPVAGPPLERGTVTVRGDRVESVDAPGVRPADEDLGHAAIIPGLVNAHTHLDLSGARGLIPPTDPAHFTDWLRGVIAYRGQRTPEQVQADIRAGLAECLRYGTTLVGDIAAEGASWDPVSAAAVRGVVFRELIGLSEERAAAIRRDAAEWHRAVKNTPMCRKGWSPHAPYSVRFDLFLAATGENDCLAFHFAESPAELELLASRSGPFVDFLASLRAWDPSGLAPNLECFLPRSRSAGHVLIVHGNYMPVEWCKYLGGLVVVYCPRTHAAFGHPPHPFREFLARGVRVALGTDSLASNPDLDLFAEAAFVKHRHPDVPGETVLRMATLAGAEALGWADECGSLEPGKSADFVAVLLPDRAAADPHEALFAADLAAPRRTMFRGEWRE